MTHKQIVSAGLAALVVLVVLTGTALAAHNIMATVTTGGGYTTATYNVTSDGSPAISHVVIPGCYEITPTVTGCPGPVTYGTDPTTNITGYKCDAGGSYALTFIWPGELTTATMDAGIKAGAGFQLVPVETVTCIPQAVVIDRFEWVNGGFEWDATQDGAGYWIIGPYYRSAYVPAQSPGAYGWFSYRYAPWQRLRDGVYELWAQDVNGQVNIAATLVKGR